MPDLSGYADYDPSTATLTFVRALRHPPEVVWRSLTDPGELSHWFPCQLHGEIRLGAELTFAFPGTGYAPWHGTVSACEEPRLLAFGWGPDQLRFELDAATAGGSVLTLTVTLETDDKAARDGAGWHQCLGRLTRQVAHGDGTPPTMEVTADWREYYEEYQRRGLPARAEIPE
jgi:uncharacterized protein YndB with AHSA1/START domain